MYTLRANPGTEYFATPRKKGIRNSSWVLVFPTSVLDKLGQFHGIRTDYSTYYDALLNGDNSFWMPRNVAEANVGHKQIISYVIVKIGGSVLRFTRGKFTTVGEKLQDMYSIGFGGHVEKSDWSLFSFVNFGYQASVARELYEEIKLDIAHLAPDSMRVIGVLNDDSTDLGRCHFAIIHLIELPEIPGPYFAEHNSLFAGKEMGDDPAKQSLVPYRRGELSVRHLTLLPIKDLARDFRRYEYWSQLCIQEFFAEKLDIVGYIDPPSKSALRKHARVVAVAGHIGSGKTEVSRLLEREFGYYLVSVSRVLVGLLGYSAEASPSRQELQEAGWEYVNAPGGHRKLAQALAQVIQQQPSARYVIDGLRYPQTLNELKFLLGGEESFHITVIYMAATIDMKYKYYIAREKSGASFDEYMRVIYHPVERPVERFADTADILVFNFGSRDSLVDMLRTYFSRELAF